jgi:hypothetical protein
MVLDWLRFSKKQDAQEALKEAKCAADEMRKKRSRVEIEIARAMENVMAERANAKPE